MPLVMPLVPLGPLIIVLLGLIIFVLLGPVFYLNAISYAFSSAWTFNLVPLGPLILFLLEPLILVHWDLFALKCH